LDQFIFIINGVYYQWSWLPIGIEVIVNELMVTYMMINLFLIFLEDKLTIYLWYWSRTTGIR